MVCGTDGLAIFDRLHSKGHDDACFLYAFDLLEVEGEDLRGLALQRKRKLERCSVVASPASFTTTTWMAMER